jgi:hypothetical protein
LLLLFDRSVVQSACRRLLAYLTQCCCGGRSISSHRAGNRKGAQSVLQKDAVEQWWKDAVHLFHLFVGDGGEDAHSVLTHSCSSWCCWRPSLSYAKTLLGACAAALTHHGKANSRCSSRERKDVVHRFQFVLLPGAGGENSVSLAETELVLTHSCGLQCHK